MEEYLPTFKQENPHLQVLEDLQPGRHPYLKAEYREYHGHPAVGLTMFLCQMLSDFAHIKAYTPCILVHIGMPAGNGRVRTVGVKNELPDGILRHAVMLRSAAGRSTHVKVKTRQVQPAIRTEDGKHQRASPSVQGMWQPSAAL